MNDLNIKDILNSHGMSQKLYDVGFAVGVESEDERITKEVKKLIKEHKHEIKEGICESHHYLERVLKIIEG